MAPKYKKKPISERFQCDKVEGERFHAPTEDVFRFNWWEVFCFPYILCSRIWDCFVSLCAGTNQCLVYWMMIQWLVCKITRITTPDPIIFPYYFYMFCQVILLTVFFVLIWIYLGKSLLIPFLMSFYEAFTEDEPTSRSTSSSNGPTFLFRRYCFRKGEIFGEALKQSEATSSYAVNPTFGLFTAFLEVFVSNILHQ